MFIHKSSDAKNGANLLTQLYPIHTANNNLKLIQTNKVHDCVLTRLIKLRYNISFADEIYFVCLLIGMLPDPNN